MKKSTWIVLTALLAPFFAGATGPNDGGGGDAVRLDIVAVRDYVYRNCEKFTELKNAGISCTDLKNKMDEVGIKTDRLILQETVDLGDGHERDGRNRPKVPDITYSRQRWLEAQADTIRKIGIELHENLGLLGIEGTDDYHVSSKVVNELRENKSVETSAAVDPASRCTLKFDVSNDPQMLGILSYTVVNESGNWITPLEAKSLEDVTKQFRAIKASGMCDPNLSCKVDYDAMNWEAGKSTYFYSVNPLDKSGWVTPLTATTAQSLAAQFKTLVSAGICHRPDVKPACTLQFYGNKVGGGHNIYYSNVLGTNGQVVTQIASESTNELAKKFKAVTASGLCGK